ncbi:hypothetical protein AVEN_20467-1, partial [Araneus ventricosus]
MCQIFLNVFQENWPPSRVPVRYPKPTTISGASQVSKTYHHLGCQSGIQNLPPSRVPVRYPKPTTISGASQIP